MKEIWKDVVGYEGFYQVSNLGNVKSLSRLVYMKRNNCYKTISERILVSTLNKQGYLQVNLSVKGKRKNKRINRLVAESFIPNPENKPQVNHIDEIKTKNLLSNLEWATPKENSNHGSKIQNSLKPIIQSNKNGIELRQFKSATEASLNGFDGTAISKCCNGIIKTHKGFKWSFKDK